MSRGIVALEDIALKLDLSVSTVSRALRGMPGIHLATRKRILTEAKRAGYVPQKREHTYLLDQVVRRQILVLSAGAGTPGGYLQGLSEAASESGATLQMHHCPVDRCGELLDDARLPQSLREQTCEGVILIYHWPAEVVSALAERCPLVSIMHDYPESRVDVVGIDTYRGMRQLVRHLTGLGHRKLGFYGLMPAITWSRARYGAFMEACADAGVEVEPQAVVRIEHTPNSGRELDARDKPTLQRVTRAIKAGVRAWVAADDFLGYRLGEALFSVGQVVPRDVSITGFHRHDYVHAPTVPRLVSTHTDSVNMGRQAFRQLVRRIEGDKSPPVMLLTPAEFAPGESCAS